MGGTEGRQQRSAKNALSSLPARARRDTDSRDRRLLILTFYLSMHGVGPARRPVKARSRRTRGRVSPDPTFLSYAALAYRFKSDPHPPNLSNSSFPPPYAAGIHGWILPR